MPPKSEEKVVSKAKCHEFFLSARHIGVSITSGGTGKKEDSEKLKKHK